MIMPRKIQTIRMQNWHNGKLPVFYTDRIGDKKTAGSYSPIAINF
jgi:hypothetical protein